jgi:hypothetical protein
MLVIRGWWARAWTEKNGRNLWRGQDSLWVVEPTITIIIIVVVDVIIIVNRAQNVVQWWLLVVRCECFIVDKTGESFTTWVRDVFHGDIHWRQLLQAPVWKHVYGADILRARFTAVTKTLYVSLHCHSTTFLRSPRHNWAICPIDGKDLCHYDVSVSCIVSHLVTDVFTSRSSLNMWQPKSCFIAVNRCQSLGDQFPLCNHSHLIYLVRKLPDL